MNGPSRVTGALLSGAIGVFVLLYLASIGPYWNISPDSVSYVGWARDLAQGQGWTALPLLPPGSSLAYALVMCAFPTGYVALNAFATLLVLAGLALAYRIIEPEKGRIVGATSVLLSLAWTGLQYQKTQLLSEPLYLLLSTGAILLLSDRDGEYSSGGRRGTLALVAGGGLLILCALTRTIGVLLALAVLVVYVWARFRKQRPASTVPIVFALLTFVAVVAWDLALERSYLDIVVGPFLRESAWAPGSALSGGDILARLRMNADVVPAVGRLLVNDWSTGSAALDFAVRTTGLMVFAIGLVSSMRRHVTIAGLYVLMYVGAIAVTAAVEGASDTRFYVPVAPWIFLYAFEGAALVARLLHRIQHRIPAAAPRVLTSLYVVLFVAVGLAAATRAVAVSHSSPFGDYPIKRPSNFDVQRLALWLRDSSAQGSTFASEQRDMVELLAEREGLPLTRDQMRQVDSFVSWLEAEGVRYLLVDRTLQVGRAADSAVHERPRTFRVIRELRRAALYEIMQR